MAFNNINIDHGLIKNTNNEKESNRAQLKQHAIPLMFDNHDQDKANETVNNPWLLLQQQQQPQQHPMETLSLSTMLEMLLNNKTTGPGYPTNDNSTTNGVQILPPPTPTSSKRKNNKPKKVTFVPEEYEQNRKRLIDPATKIANQHLTPNFLSTDFTAVTASQTVQPNKDHQVIQLFEHARKEMLQVAEKTPEQMVGEIKSLHQQIQNLSKLVNEVTKNNFEMMKINRQIMNGNWQITAEQEWLKMNLAINQVVKRSPQITTPVITEEQTTPIITEETQNLPISTATITNAAKTTSSRPSSSSLTYNTNIDILIKKKSEILIQAGIKLLQKQTQKGVTAYFSTNGEKSQRKRRSYAITEEDNTSDSESEVYFLRKTCRIKPEDSNLRRSERKRYCTTFSTPLFLATVLLCFNFATAIPALETTNDHLQTLRHADDTQMENTPWTVKDGNDANITTQWQTIEKNLELILILIWIVIIITTIMWYPYRQCAITEDPENDPDDMDYNSTDEIYNDASTFNMDKAQEEEPSQEEISLQEIIATLTSDEAEYIRIIRKHRIPLPKRDLTNEMLEGIKLYKILPKYAEANNDNIHRFFRFKNEFEYLLLDLDVHGTDENFYELFKFCINMPLRADMEEEFVYKRYRPSIRNASMIITEIMDRNFENYVNTHDTLIKQANDTITEFATKIRRFINRKMVDSLERYREKSMVQHFIRGLPYHVRQIVNTRHYDLLDEAVKKAKEADEFLKQNERTLSREQSLTQKRLHHILCPPLLYANQDNTTSSKGNQYTQPAYGYPSYTSQFGNQPAYDNNATYENYYTQPIYDICYEYPQNQQQSGYNYFVQQDSQNTILPAIMEQQINEPAQAKVTPKQPKHQVTTQQKTQTTKPAKANTKQKLQTSHKTTQETHQKKKKPEATQKLNQQSAKPKSKPKQTDNMFGLNKSPSIIIPKVREASPNKAADGSDIKWKKITEHFSIAPATITSTQPNESKAEEIKRQVIIRKSPTVNKQKTKTVSVHQKYIVAETIKGSLCAETPTCVNDALEVQRIALQENKFDSPAPQSMSPTPEPDSPSQ